MTRTEGTRTEGIWAAGVWQIRVRWKGSFALCSFQRGAASPESFVLRYTGDRRDLVRHFRRVLLRLG